MDWSTVRSATGISMVGTTLLGPPEKRVGYRLLWLCPFHDDRHPSFEVDLNRKTWRCWSCGVGGDAAALVMKVRQCRFPEAVRFLADLVGVFPTSKDPATGPSASKPPRTPPERPSGLPPEESSVVGRGSRPTALDPPGERLSPTSMGGA